MNEKNCFIEKGNIRQARTYYHYISDLKEKIEKQNNLISKLEKDTNAAKNKLISISKEKKIYEKLKENHKQEFDESLKKVEEKFLDQIVSFKSSSSIGGKL